MTETFCKNSSISFSEYYFIISAVQKKMMFDKIAKMSLVFLLLFWLAGIPDPFNIFA